MTAITFWSSPREKSPDSLFVGAKWVLLTTGDGCQQQMKSIPALPIELWNYFA